VPEKEKTLTAATDRQELLLQIQRLAETAVFGTISETYGKCGKKSCRCHGPGPLHGPKIHVSYRGPEGKTASYFVPKAAHAAVRDGVAAWKELQIHLKALADLNRQRILDQARKDKTE
jgi:hypothetical protein